MFNPCSCPCPCPCPSDTTYSSEIAYSFNSLTGIFTFNLADSPLAFSSTTLSVHLIFKSCPIVFNSDNTFSYVASSGETYILPDESFIVNVNGVYRETFTLPTLG